MNAITTSDGTRIWYKDWGPKDAAYDLLGQTYYSVAEYEQAARVYRNLAKVDPTNQLARVRLQELAAVRSQG